MLGRGLVWFSSLIGMVLEFEVFALHLHVHAACCYVHMWIPALPNKVINPPEPRITLLHTSLQSNGTANKLWITESLNNASGCLFSSFEGKSGLITLASQKKTKKNPSSKSFKWVGDVIIMRHRPLLCSCYGGGTVLHEFRPLPLSAWMAHLPVRKHFSC